MEIERLRAASHISRWRGWTHRPYSNLEHMNTGTEVLRRMRMPESVQRLFLIHDMHETEVIGDVPTPDKVLFCNDRFRNACNSFDRALFKTLSMSPSQYDIGIVAHLDRDMAIVEHDTLVTRRCPEIPDPNWDKPEHEEIRNILITSGGVSVNHPTVWINHAYRLGIMKR